MPPNDNMTAKEFLYYYSTYCKDLQEAKQEAERIASAQKGKRRIRMSNGK